MAYEFRLPDLGEGVAEGEIARWLVAEGAARRRRRPSAGWPRSSAWIWTLSREAGPGGG